MSSLQGVRTTGLCAGVLETHVGPESRVEVESGVSQRRALAEPNAGQRLRPRGQSNRCGSFEDLVDRARGARKAKHKHCDGGLPTDVAADPNLFAQEQHRDAARGEVPHINLWDDDSTRLGCSASCE